MTGIFHSQADVRTGLCFGIACAKSVVDFDSPRGERDLPAIGHRVTRVEREVHDDLIDVARVGKNRGKLWSELHVESDVLADKPAQHGNGLLDNFIERDRSPLNDLLAAVGEKLAGQSRGAFRRSLHLIKRRSEFFVESRIAQLHRRISEDDGENVIEIVGHSGSETADCFHFLRLT